MIDTYPDTLALFAIHLSDTYAIPWGGMRANLYGVQAIPFSTHDGLYDAWPISTYESKFLARQVISTDVTIDMVVFGAGATRDVFALVCIEPGGVGKTMNVWMAQALDHYGPANHDRNMLRVGTDGVEITLAPDECVWIRETFVLDSVSQASPDNVKFFAWAQDPAFVGGWAEIHQGGKAVPPFSGILYDGFEDGTTAAWDLTVP